MRQIAKEAARVKASSNELKKKAQVQEYRLEEATIRMRKIEADDKERCRKTAALLKDFEEKSGNGPFFESLLNLLINYQG